MQEKFNALVVNKTETDFTVGVQPLYFNDLPNGNVLIKTAYSSINYKDGLAATPNGKIVRSYPFVPGIDLAGTVVSSVDPRFREGDKVIATSYEIGVTHFGGYSEYASNSGRLDRSVTRKSFFKGSDDLWNSWLYGSPFDRSA